LSLPTRRAIFLKTGRQAPCQPANRQGRCSVYRHRLCTIRATAAKKGDLSLGLCPLEIDRLSSKHTHQQWNSDVLSGGIFYGGILSNVLRASIHLMPPPSLRQANKGYRKFGYFCNSYEISVCSFGYQTGRDVLHGG